MLIYIPKIQFLYNIVKIFSNTFCIQTGIFIIFPQICEPTWVELQENTKNYSYGILKHLLGAEIQPNHQPVIDITTTKNLMTK